MESIAVLAGSYIPPTPRQPKLPSVAGSPARAGKLPSVAGSPDPSKDGDNESEQKTHRITKKTKDNPSKNADAAAQAKMEALKELGKAWSTLSPETRKDKCLDLIEVIYNLSLHWDVPDVPDVAAVEIGDIVYLDTSPLVDGKRHAEDEREEYPAIVVKSTDKGFEVQDLEQNDGLEIIEDKLRFVHVVDAATAFSGM
jgi:hypothetical protein